MCVCLFVCLCAMEAHGEEAVVREHGEHDV